MRWSPDGRTEPDGAGNGVAFIIVNWLAFQPWTAARRWYGFAHFLISTIGIALGVAVLIVGLSAMNGFERS